MELNEISISENKDEEEKMNIKTKSAEQIVENHSYINTNLVVAADIDAKGKRENHIYEHLHRANINTCMARFKQYQNCIVLGLIGVLFIAVTVIAIFIGLPEKSGINGEWSTWGSWSPCSATCDFGTSHRERNCSNPIPENGGRFCPGWAYELQLCNKMLCPAIDGGWSAWSLWGTCSATCGTGLHSRNRTCSNSAPAQRGQPCVGDVSETQLCDKKACEGIDGGWSVWGSWTQCSVTCDYGMTYRERTCSNPIPERGGLYCSGSSTDIRLCNQALCPAINGGWSAWSTWGTCSATCGTGLQRRTRTCTNPAPEPRGRPCSGDVSEQQLCNTKPCDGSGIGFSVYSPWNESSSPLRFIGIKYNYENSYNDLTGEFVCKQQGLYYFQANLFRRTAKVSDKQSFCGFLKNGGFSNNGLHVYSSEGYPAITGSALLYLTPGDRIAIGDCYNVETLVYTSSFSGFLINAN